MAPDISVLITTYNRSDLLELCLQSLDRQTAPPECYEIVVVIDGSTDDTLEMLGKLTLRCSLTVAQEQSGSTAGRNVGAANARGRLLLFVDDDELADPGLVTSHLDAHRSRPSTVVLGAIERRVPENSDRLARLGCEDAAWRTRSSRAVRQRFGTAYVMGSDGHATGRLRLPCTLARWRAGAAQGARGGRQLAANSQQQ